MEFFKGLPLNFPRLTSKRFTLYFQKYLRILHGSVYIRFDKLIGNTVTAKRLRSLFVVPQHLNKYFEDLLKIH